MRFVSVKGLAERNVKADLALRPTNYVEAGNELAQVEAKVGTDDAAVWASSLGAMHRDKYRRTQRVKLGYASHYNSRVRTAGSTCAVSKRNYASEI